MGNEVEIIESKPTNAVLYVLDVSGEKYPHFSMNERQITLLTVHFVG